MIKIWSPRIVWGLVGLCVAVAWGELITRAFYPQNVDTILDILRADPVCGYIYQPNVSVEERGRGYDVPFETNSLGLREREIPAKQPDVLRILVIGNSFVVSHGVDSEHSFPRAVEDALNDLSSAFKGYRAVETINAANAGYNANNYRTAYDRWASELSSDLVVVGFVPDREYRSDPAGTQYVVENGLVTGRFQPGQTPHRAGSNPLRAVRKSLARNSHLYVLLRNFFFYNDKVARLTGDGSDGDSARRALQAYLVEPPESVERGWERTYGHLATLDERVRSDGRQLVIAAIPTIDGIDDKHREMLRRQAGLPESAIDPDEPLRRLREFCKDRNIPLVEMEPAVKQAAARESVFLFDNHWNAKGIEAGAEVVARRMRQLGLPPFATADDR